MRAIGGLVVVAMSRSGRVPWQECWQVVKGDVICNGGATFQAQAPLFPPLVMFLKQKEPVHLDLSIELRDPDVWKVGALRTLDYPLKITALASEPVSGLLAVGMSFAPIR